MFESAILRYVNDEMNQPISDSYQHLIRRHVVRYVDRSEDPITPLLVLEFVEGRTMNDVFREKPLAENIATQYTAILLKVVTALHARGIVHRDISPSNIILSKRGLVLVDFGTCQTLLPIVGTGRLVTAK